MVCPAKESVRSKNSELKESFMMALVRCMEKNQFPLLWSGIAASALLGAYGYSDFLSREMSWENLLLILYSTLQLFTLESNLDIKDPVHPTLQIARVLAPALLGFTAWKTFASLFADQLRMISLPLVRNHVVICGLGERGFHLARSFRGRGVMRKKVVVIEPDMENEYITNCKHMGIIVLAGNANDPTILRSARVTHAESAYILTGDDGVNVGITMQIRELLHAGKRRCKAPLRCSTAITDLLLTELARAPNRIPSDSQFEFTILRLSALSARLLFNTHPLDGCGFNAESTDTVHLIVAGFGNVGENVAFQAARLGQFAGDKQVAITVIDSNANRKLALYMQMLPGLIKCAAWEAVDMDILSADFIDWLESCQKKHTGLFHVVVCINDPSLSVRTALRIHRAFPAKNIQVYVRLENFENPGKFLSSSAMIPEETDIYPFGVLSEICSCETINDSQLDTLARAIHRQYQDERKAEGKNDDSTVPWEKLDHDRKESNRHQADHIPVKMRAIGYAIAPADISRQRDRITGFTNEEIESLARMEHRRWNAERFIGGWKYGKTRDLENRISPYLIGYDELPEEIKYYDRQTVRTIPQFLEKAGLWVYRGNDQVKEPVAGRQELTEQMDEAS